MYLYGIGMSDRDISRTIEEIYGFSLSHETISNITEEILPFIHAWRSRPLQPVCPFVFIDALYTSVKDEKRSYKKAIYAIAGIDANGMKDVLGFWQREREGAEEWLNIFDELKQRGVRKICFASADRSTGIAEAVRSAFDKSTIFRHFFQRCIAHIIRNSLKYIPRKYYKEFCADLKPMYGAVSLESAEANFDKLRERRGDKYPGEQNLIYVAMKPPGRYSLHKMIDAPFIIRSGSILTLIGSPRWSLSGGPG